MNRKVILSVVASIIVLLVGIPFFMYGEDGYSFPQALLMVILIDLLCYSPAKLVIAKKSDEISVLKQILKYIIVAAPLVSGKLLLRIRKYLINNIFRGQTPVHDLKCLHLQSVS